MSVKSKKVVIVHECYSKHNSNVSFLRFLIRFFYKCCLIYDPMKSNDIFETNSVTVV